MAGLLRAPSITDEKRIKNCQKHSPWIVFSVLFLLILYIYLFTHSFSLLEIPSPKKLLNSLGIHQIKYVFDQDGQVDSKFAILFAPRFQTDNMEKGIFYLIAIGAFLFSYFLPFSLKEISLIFFAVLGIGLLYGIPALSGMIFAHSIIYLILHPKKEEPKIYLALLPGIFGYFTFFYGIYNWKLTFLVLFPIFSLLVYQYIILPLLSQSKIASILRTLVIQSALIVLLISGIIEGTFGKEWKLWLFLILFFFKSQRLVMYHIDYKDGHIPEGISFFQYLAVFISPAMIINWGMVTTMPQGYSYMKNKFLWQDHNKIIGGGIQILLLALGYLIFGDLIIFTIVDIFSSYAYQLHGADTYNLVQHYMEGGKVSTLSVLLTTLLDFFRWLVLWGSIAHFKTGIWRICGYDVDPYFDKPWMATNLVSFWPRYTYHFREFMVKAFYYPAFFTFFKKHRKTRILVATLAAATVGNMLWHFLDEMLWNGNPNWEYIAKELYSWPYFVFLGLGIALTELYLLKYKQKRRPWTGKFTYILGDILAAYCTIQFYALIRIFHRSIAGSTVMDHFKLFFLGFGIQ